MIRYTTIKYGGCCGQPEREFQVPDNITPHELSLLIPGLSLEDAVELLARRIEPDPSCDSFSSQLIQRQVRKECLPPAQGTLVTITIPAGRFISTLSQLDADQQAEAEFQRIAQSTANQLGGCVVGGCTNCTAFRVVRTIACGEFRRDTTCSNGQCVDTSQEYFVCTGNCEGENCRQSCITCSSICPTGNCPAGSSCVNGSCKVNCENAQCSLDCPQGSCQDPCTECRDGRCQPRQCPSGQICQNGQCVNRPCDPECSERLIEPGPNDCIQRSIVQSCQSGRCVDTTEERLVNIREGVSCGTGRVCRNGQCIENCVQGTGGSCSQSNPCCSAICHNGTCVTSCPQGYIQQGGTCVVDNGPNVEVSQSSTTVESNFYYTTSGVSAGSANANITIVRHIGLAATYKNQYVQPRTLILGTVNSPSEAVPPWSFNPSTEIYIKLQNTNLAGIEAALNQYIVQELNPIFGSDYNISIASPGQSTWVSSTTGVTISGFMFTAKSPQSAPISGFVFFRQSGVTSLVISVRMRISPSPYNIPGYSPNPSSFTGFGFDGNWKSFSISSQEGNFNNLEGRIVSGQLEVRNSTNTRIFGNIDFSFRRLIGTFTVGTTVTKTLQ